MKTQTLPLNELSRQAVAILVREIGVVATLRFLSQYSNGAGDYTNERRTLLPDLPMDDLIAEARRIDEDEHARERE